MLLDLFPDLKAEAAFRHFALESLDLETLAARRGKRRHSMLLKLLANEENHNSLINAYENLMDTRLINM